MVGIFLIFPEIVDFAEQHEFVIIELPWELRFMDLQREVMNEINYRQQGFIERAREIQKFLIDLVIQGKDITEMIAYVEQELNSSIVFVDKSGRMNATVDDPQEIVNRWESKQHVAEVIEDDLAFRHIKSVWCEKGYMLHKEITSGTIHVAQGYFIVILHNQNKLTANVLQVLDSLSAATALWISREDAIVKTEIRLRNEFIWGLAKTPQKMSMKAYVHVENC